ncbi:hypothetical protein V5T82_13565 [Magnetovibrio sp. PR-2]|uniref:hypothetical protein n=1 Tax=Magnetovibrio sp. PR-2 TaxID=3120356 RepID=UPI002FCE2B07
MRKEQAKIEKAIEEAEKAINAGKVAEQQKRKAQRELSELKSKDHLDRLYNIGRIAFDIGVHKYDDALLAGVFVRAAELDIEGHERLREKGLEALTSSQLRHDIELFLPGRADRSQAAILREAGLKKDRQTRKDGKTFTVYKGNASKKYLEKRLNDPHIVINIVTPVHRDVEPSSHHGEAQL